MEIEFKRIDDAFHFEATGMSGVSVHIDASTEHGGHNAGARPMELMLMSLGSCAAIDVILILNKQKQTVDDFGVKVSGERVKIEGTEMTPFREINVHFMLKGNLDEKRVARAISLSIEKYCSATAQLSASAKITHSFEIKAAE